MVLQALLVDAQGELVLLLVRALLARHLLSQIDDFFLDDDLNPVKVCLHVLGLLLEVAQVAFVRQVLNFEVVVQLRAVPDSVVVQPEELLLELNRPVADVEKLRDLLDHLHGHVFPYFELFVDVLLVHELLVQHRNLILQLADVKDEVVCDGLLLDLQLELAQLLDQAQAFSAVRPFEERELQEELVILAIDHTEHLVDLLLHGDPILLLVALVSLNL